MPLTRNDIGETANRQFYLGEKQIMAWLSENWVWVLIGAGFIGMHMFGHGGHGHGGRENDKPPAKDGNQGASKKGPGYQH